MADGPEAPAEGIAYNRLFPWVRLFRAFGIASNAKMLILAALGLVLAHAGWSGLDRAFSRTNALAPPWAASARHDRLTGMTVYPSLTVVHTEAARGLGGDTPSAGPNFWEQVQTAPWRLTEPVRAVVGPFVPVFAPESTTATFFHAMLTAFWGVLVWGLVGGAIARIALLEVARGRPLNLTGAARFAARNAVPLAVAPLCPLFAIGALALACALFGLLYRVPGGAGTTAAGAFAFVPLLVGLVMTVVIVSLALGWPLMAPAVAAEEEDSFDAMSRSFAYVNQRRGHYLGYIVLAWLVGTVGLVFVDVFARVVVHLAEWGLSFSAPRDVLLALWGGAAAGASTAAWVHSFWIGVVRLIAHAWVYSYFWTSSAIVYLLLRHSVDGTPFHELSIAAEPAASFGSSAPAPRADNPAATAADNPAATAEVS